MKHHIIYILALIALTLLGACRKHRSNNNSRIGLLEVAIDTVRPTQIRFTITPENEDIYYSHSLYFHELTEGLTKEQIKEQETEVIKYIYEKIYQSEEGYSFKEALLYYENRTFTKKELIPDKDYDLLVYQVDPDKQAVIGDLKLIPLHTPHIDSVLLNFDVQFTHDSLHIYPSHKNTPYIWAYETQEDIYNLYYAPNVFFHKIVEMYEEYGFIEHETTLGEVHLSLKEDLSLHNGKDYTMVLAGYNGEINSKLTILPFRSDF